MRAKLSRNSAKLKEFEMKFSELCSIVDGLSRTHVIPDRAEEHGQSPSAPSPPSSSAAPGSPRASVPQTQTSRPTELSNSCCHDSLVDLLEASSETESSDFIFSDPEVPVSRSRQSLN